MNLRTVYSEYMRERNVQGSGQASSYIRALDLLVPILAKPKSKFAHFPNLWEIQSSTQISALYEYVLEQQRLGEDGLFKGTVFLYGFSIAALSWKKVCLNLLRYPLQIQEGLGEDLALCA